MDVVLFTWDKCSFCERGRHLLDAWGKAWREESLDGRRELLRRLQASSGHRTVPLLMVDGEILGGLPELEAWLAGQA